MAEQHTNTGIGFLSILTLIFITLRLIGKITWSWWWVLSPILIPVGLFVFTIVGMLLLIVAVMITEWF